LNLYDQGGLLGAADVTVVGNTVGKVNGSLVVHAAGDQVTFVKTGSALANDTYTVTLRSASNGFRNAAHLLDGNADGTPGDDYVTTFTRNVASAAVTASIPDFARGHGQVVNVWNFGAQTVHEGIPVLLSSGSGISGVDLTIRYDPSLLVIDAAQLGAGLASGVSLAYFIPTPGTIHITVSSPGALATSVGPIVLLGLMRVDTANPGQLLGPLVPDTATYGGKHMLEITNLHVFDSSPLTNELPSVANSGVHVAAYPGELSGNQRYNAPDTSFMQQLVLNSATFGLAAYPLTDPLILADINANGAVQANDTAQVQRLILGQGSPFVPGLPPAGAMSLVLIPAIATDEYSVATPRRAWNADGERALSWAKIASDSHQDAFARSSERSLTDVKTSRRIDLAAADLLHGDIESAWYLNSCSWDGDSVVVRVGFPR
jgi:hypothetical protein